VTVVSDAEGLPLPADHQDAAAQFTRLLEIMACLRAPDGCPWDREQTIDTLKKYVLEETYEVIDAIDRHDHQALREELGDFLLQAVFLAQLEEEAGHFSIADSARAISDKLIRRHPHVFRRDEAGNALETANQVKTRWEEIKSAERGGSVKPQTLLSGLPAALPALLRAHHISARAASVGFDWHRATDVVGKMREEVEEIAEVVGDAGPPNRDRLEEEVGDLLFAMANLARKLDIEPEAALRKANDKFTKRFTAMEGRIEQSGSKMAEMSLEELEAEWQVSKQVP
jgi:MazG family protein